MLHRPHPQANLGCQESRPIESPIPAMAWPVPRLAPQPVGRLIPPDNPSAGPRARLAPGCARRSAPESSWWDCGAGSIENPSPNPKPEHRATCKQALRFPKGTAYPAPHDERPHRDQSEGHAWQARDPKNPDSVETSRSQTARWHAPRRPARRLPAANPNRHRSRLSLRRRIRPRYLPSAGRGYLTMQNSYKAQL